MEPSFTPDFLSSHQYKEFKEEMKRRSRRKRWYEKLCALAEKWGLDIDEELTKKIEDSIRFSELNITPKGVFNLALYTFLFSFMIWLLFILFSFSLNLSVPGFVMHSPLILGTLLSYYLYKYPSMKSTVNRIRYGENLILAVLYMIIYMKTNKNLEGAVRYAAANVKGKISEDLKSILWKVEMGEYTTVDEALTDYASYWKSYMKEFTQAIYLIKESMLEPDESRKDALLEKAIDVILEGTSERMKQYSRDLEMPIQVIHAMGIILPVLGMVVLPLLTIFLSNALTNLGIYLFLFYDVLLPVGVLFFINNTIEKRPSTFGSVDISMHPNLPGKNRFYVFFKTKSGRKRKEVSIPLVISILAVILLLPSFTWFLSSIISYERGSAPILPSVLVVLSISILAALYYYLNSFQKIKFREEIAEMEREFEDALFVLGNRLSGGVPAEKALEKSYEDVKTLRVGELFKVALDNMSRFGMTFKQALFDDEKGALRYFPSSLIRNIMLVLSTTIEKGTKVASLSMLTISRYLRSMRITQEKINDLLGSVLSSMKFNAYILVPIISGVIVGVSRLILVLLIKMSGIYNELIKTSLEGTEQGINVGGMGKGGLLVGIEHAIPTPLVQLIVGLYAVEILIILSLFMSRIKYGFDEIKEADEAWKIILIGTAVYIVTFFIMNLVFSGITANIISGLEEL